MTSDFSLLLPVYAKDDPAQLLRAFRSAVDEQVLRPTEAVIVRDGPVPEALAATLAELAASSPVPTRVLELPVNAGLAPALTAGLAACSYDVVARMDADDVSVPERFSKEIALLDTGFDLVGSGLAEFEDDEDVVIGVRTPPVGEAHIQRYARFHQPFNHPTVVYRRSAVERAGGYVAVGLMEDYWLFARMLASGSRAENIPEPLLKYRVGAGAYRRRGGVAQLGAELRLQRLLLRTGFTTPAQTVRNVVVRGGYRLVPEALRKVAYRTLIQRGFRRGASA
ncbi:glycosyltransferase [Amnibacterium kyonggiense]|uniref:Glycosyl transferase family 2 n=1 Tax=Amnibacterium kyonggiense TaxID=595671 RepID=A0A4R7FIY3_9MICO|nr:glycosyltransferase [Amnibacterium kyonggiense]TDS74982.1 glycosyl transferase family 2 [Amnibacterium kyonggiense]